MKPLEKQFKETLNTLNAYEAAVNKAAIVSITDLQGKIVYVNDKFIEISGYCAKELIGKTHRVINSGEHSAEFFRAMWMDISSGKLWRGEIKNKARDGSFYWVDTVITPVYDSDKKIFQYLSIRNLITDRKISEEKLLLFQQELLNREQQLKDAQAVAKTGSWYLKMRENIIQWSDESYHIFEIPVGSPVSYSLFLEYVHPDDRPLLEAKWEQATTGTQFEFEHRIIINSKIKWVRERARLEYNEHHQLVGATGTVQDITEMKLFEVHLKESEALYRNLFDNSPVPVGIVDKETHRFFHVNKAAINLYGYSEEEFSRLTLFNIRAEEEHPKLKELLAGSHYSSDVTIRTHRRKNGDILQIEPYIKEIMYKDRPAYLISINDVTEKLKMQAQLVKAKITRQKEISRATMEALEQNKAEIGRELHDNVNQLLVAAQIYLKTIHIDSASESKSVSKSQEVIAQAIEEIRRLSQTLAPPPLQDLSLQDSIENLAGNLRLVQMQVNVRVALNERQLSNGFKLNVYRIIQEQFNNVIKHAGAKRVDISLIQQGNQLTLDIADDGKGFDARVRPKGIGLINIAHRSETYNGEMTIESSPGKGCQVHVLFRLDGLLSSSHSS